jgi:hypothetical protein
MCFNSYVEGSEIGIQLTGLINNVNFPHKLLNLPTMKLASMNDKITIINDEFASAPNPSLD